jgi:hypothetical protein
MAVRNDIPTRSASVPSARPTVDLLSSSSGAPRDLEYVGIGERLFHVTLNASKNDHVMNLSSDRREAAGRESRWTWVRSMALPSQTSMLGSCAVADRYAFASSVATSRGPVL